MAETKKLFINLKGQDALREWFTKRGEVGDLVLKFISLGDSDVNYELSQQVENIEILPAPYSIPKIKYKMAYEGQVGNIKGKIEAIIRKIDADGNILSLYNYPPDQTFIQGKIPPTVENKKDWSSLDFSSNKEGYVIFLQTLPDNYFAEDGTTPLRLVEQYDIEVENLPYSGFIDNREPIKIIDISTNIPSIFTTDRNHGLTTNDIISIKEVLGDTIVNGVKRVERKSDTTFCVYNDITPLSSTDQFTTTTPNQTGIFVRWDVAIDQTNGSLIIAKHANTILAPLVGNSDGLIKITGKTSGIIKYINFNY